MEKLFEGQGLMSKYSFVFLLYDDVSECLNLSDGWEGEKGASIVLLGLFVLVFGLL